MTVTTETETPAGTRAGFALILTTAAAAAAIRQTPIRPEGKAGYIAGLQQALRVYARATDPVQYDHDLRDLARVLVPVQNICERTGDRAGLAEAMSHAGGLLNALQWFRQAGSPT